MKSRYLMFARYNRWANERLYDATAALPDAEYRADRGAFFKSLHGTLNHLLVADRIWMRRFTGTGTAPDELDAILHQDFTALREARRAEDERISRYVDGLGEGDAVLDENLRDIEIGTEREGDGELQIAVGSRLAAHVEHVLDAVDFLLQRRRYRIADDFGGSAGIGRRDLHGDRCNARVLLDG